MGRATPADMVTMETTMGQTTASGRRFGLLTALGVGAKSAVATGTELAHRKLHPTGMYARIGRCLPNGRCAQTAPWPVF
jgi:hypothetical protein